MTLRTNEDARHDKWRATCISTKRRLYLSLQQLVHSKAKEIMNEDWWKNHPADSQLNTDIFTFEENSHQRSHNWILTISLWSSLKSTLCSGTQWGHNSILYITSSKCKCPQQNTDIITFWSPSGITTQHRHLHYSGGKSPVHVESQRNTDTFTFKCPHKFGHSRDTRKHSGVTDMPQTICFNRKKFYDLWKVFPSTSGQQKNPQFETCGFHQWTTDIWGDLGVPEYQQTSKSDRNWKYFRGKFSSILLFSLLEYQFSIFNTSGLDWFHSMALIIAQ